MTVAELYTTNLSKAQGIVPETYELLELWEPGMTGLDLKRHVKETGALGKPTHAIFSNAPSISVGSNRRGRKECASALLAIFSERLKTSS